MKNFSTKNNNFQMMMSCFLILSLIMMGGVVDAAGGGSLRKILQGARSYFQNPKNHPNFMKQLQKAKELADHRNLKDYCPLFKQVLQRNQYMAKSPSRYPRYQKFQKFTKNICK
ncbi:hypothetical protein BVRB_014730 [Beta vulgaris subsp. vulgaris]|uniref:Uncharacterized protein n=1 Tax=Beta vulgaris subsp. vulgaris TaxID=3555 RepID=A0A0J8B4R3_BETVV|nr:hypothetical protein BVRB_014730 [Beta vulgaris subsp. vulgaris]